MNNYCYRLQRFEKTNEMLLNCNALSANRLKTAGEDFKRHTKLLSEMKKDLDYIFKKIRNIKLKINAQYPEAYAAAQPLTSKSSLAEEAEDTELQTNADCNAATASTSSSQIETIKQSADVIQKKCPKSMEKKKSSGNKITIDYVQMEQSPSDSNGRKSVEIAKRCSMESNRSTSTDNSNDSSDCTSDTG